MGMNITGHICKQGTFWVDYELDHVSWWADELLLQLLQEKGTSITDEEKETIPRIDDEDVLPCCVDIRIDHNQISSIIKMIECIITDSFDMDKPDYADKYNNETQEECIVRWKKIQDDMIIFESKIDWKTEYLAIYTSY